MKHQSPDRDDLAQELTGHLEFVRRLARSLVRDEQVAEDVVQETMLAAVAHRPDPAAGLRVWLRSVLRRRVLLHFRTEQRRVARETMMLRDGGGEGATGADSEAERAAMSLERSSSLGRAVAGLDEPYRTVIVMRYFEGLAPREIATRLDRPVNTVRTQLQRGLERLRQHLDRAHDGDRRAWVVALLPHALQGPGGWWPASVRGVAGVSHGTLAVAAALLVAAIGALVAAWRDGGAEPGRPTAAGPAAVDEIGPTDLAAAEPPPPTGARAPATEPEPNEEEPGVLEVRVRTSDGPVAGARIVAEQEDDDFRRLVTLNSVVEGPNGYKLKVHARGLQMALPPTRDPAPEHAAAVTDDAGVARLEVLDGRRWCVRASAPGLAPTEIVVQERAPLAGRSILLEPATRVEVDRGSFQLESNVVVLLTSDFDEVPENGMIAAGLQELRFPRVEPGRYTLEAISARGNEVALWYMPLDVRRDTVARVDLTMGGDGRAQIEVRGASASAPAHFAYVHGPEVETGRPLWRRVAPVHDGLADFGGLPAGPAVVQILSKDSEIGHASFDVPEGKGSQRVRVDVARGGLRVTHPGQHGDDLDWRLERRSEDGDGRSGQALVGEPLADQGASRFHGLADGRYRLWVTGGAAALRREFSIEDGAVVELDLSMDAEDAEATASVMVERGAGVAEGARFQIEVAPGEWELVDPRNGALRLSHGLHRLRIALTGVGYAYREVDVPRVGEVVFSEHAAPMPLTLRCIPRDGGRMLRIAEDEPRRFAPRLRTVRVSLDSSETGVTALRPGRYVAFDRWGREAAFEVEPGQSVARLTLE